MSAWGKDYDEPYDPGPTDEDTIIPTWDRLDITPILDGTHVAQLPSLMPRNDGPALLYAGLVHSLHGESESGKSMAIQAEAARLITAGHPVLYVDFESDAATVIGRMLEMGTPPGLIAEHLDYRRPEINPKNATHELRAFYAMLEQTYILAVIDGVTEALHVFGTATKDNDELTGWIRAVPKAIARHTGAAVVLIDHVTKDADTRGRFAIGGQAKMAALDGAAYVVEVAEPLGRGLRGVIILRVAKDRPGSVRPHAGTYRKTDRTQEAARVIVDSRKPGRIDVTVEPPVSSLDAGLDGVAPFRPTTLMERISQALHGLAEPITQSQLLKSVKGNETALVQAADVLVREGYVTRSTGSRGSIRYESARRYHQADDPLSDRYMGTTATSADLRPDITNSDDQSENPWSPKSDPIHPPHRPPPDLRLTSASGGGRESTATSATTPRPIGVAELEEDIQPQPTPDLLRQPGVCPECHYRGFHATHCPNNTLDPDQETP